MEDTILQKVEKQLDAQCNDDAFDISGKNIAHKLRSLPPDTAVVTEKLIMDILFEAHLGKVDKDSTVKIINQVNRSMDFSQAGGIYRYQQPAAAQQQFQYSQVPLPRQEILDTQGFYEIHNNNNHNNVNECRVNTSSYFSTFTDDT